MIIIKGLAVAAFVGLGALALSTGADASSSTSPDAQRCPDMGLATLFAPMRN